MKIVERVTNFIVRRAKARAIKALEEAKERERKAVSYGDMYDSPNSGLYSMTAQANCEKLDKIIEILRNQDKTLENEWRDIVVRAILGIPQRIIPKYLEKF